MSETTRGVRHGVLAGLVGIMCCVGPSVAALLGFTSAAAATDLANDLYGNWGWAFRGAGLAVGLGAVVLAVRRQRTCSPRDRKRNLARFGVTLAAVGVVTYGFFYWATTELGNLAEPDDPIEVTLEGETLREQVDTAISSVKDHFPAFVVQESAVSPQLAAFQVGWAQPSISATDPGFARAMQDRIEEHREATITLLKALASDTEIARFTAFQDRLIVPVWTRTQILELGDPSDYRAFEAYSAFSAGAAEQAGYNVLFDKRSDPLEIFQPLGT